MHGHRRSPPAEQSCAKRQMRCREREGCTTEL
jgi:hypothetical protein